MDITQAITTIGFPAAVAAYSLYIYYKHMEYLEKTIGQAVQSNTQAINELKLLIVKLIEKEDNEDDI